MPASERRPRGRRRRARIVIEDNCVINWRSQIDGKNHIHLERDVLVAQDVLIVDQNHAYEDTDAPIGTQGFTPGGRIQDRTRLLYRSWRSHHMSHVASWFLDAIVL